MDLSAGLLRRNEKQLPLSKNLKQTVREHSLLTFVTFLHVVFFSPAVSMACST
jgi:hypothetical protein